MRPFDPLLKSPHLLTIAGNFWPRNLDVVRFPVRERWFDTVPGVKVLVHSQYPPGDRRGELIVVHGLEGSSQAGYAQSAAQAGLCAGFAVHRFNMRSCGGTEAFSGRTLYHSGQTDDLLTVAGQIAAEGGGPIYLIGYSLGGNVALKLAGELGAAGSDLISGVCAISTPIDLAACVEQLGKPWNYLYARRFLKRLKARVIQKERLCPGSFAIGRMDSVRTVYGFDDVFTAASFGFGSADRYYATQSSNRYLENIRVPALLVQAKDDPLIPFRVYDHPAFRRNGWLELAATEHGGHVGYLSRGSPRFWLDERMIEWLNKVGNKAWANCVS